MHLCIMRNMKVYECVCMVSIGCYYSLYTFVTVFKQVDKHFPKLQIISSFNCVILSFLFFSFLKCQYYVHDTLIRALDLQMF